MVRLNGYTTAQDKMNEVMDQRNTSPQVFDSSNPVGQQLNSSLFGHIGELFTNPTSAWDRFKNGETNQIKKAEMKYNAMLQDMTWQREDTAHQREVADMRAAGLNPAAMSNAGAPSSPGMQSNQTLSPGGGLGDVFSMFANGFSPISTALGEIARIKKTESDIVKTEAETRAIEGRESRDSDIYSLVKENQNLSNEDLKASTQSRNINNEIQSFIRDNQNANEKLDIAYKEVRNALASSEKLSNDYANRLSGMAQAYFDALGIHPGMTPAERDIALRTLQNFYSRDKDGNYHFDAESYRKEYKDIRFKDSATDFAQNIADTGLNLMGNMFKGKFSNFLNFFPRSNR